MKSHPLAVPQRTASRGFTLLELLVVMVIIAILAALTLGAFRYAQESSSRNRTVSAHGAIRAALEQYKEKFGEYPEPANPNDSDEIGSTSHIVGGAQMLYQAITADGSSAIKLQSAAAGLGESDGQVDDTEKENALNASALPKSVIYLTRSGKRILVDGWSRPFQYTKADPDPAKNEAINPTYDLWSYGPMNNDKTPSSDISTKRDPVVTGPWITNWR